jgi:hypothetical protein
MAASAFLIGAAFCLSQYDTQLRRPDTDDLPGDPPTIYLFLGLTAVVIAVVLFFSGVAAGRMKRWT